MSDEEQRQEYSGRAVEARAFRRIAAPTQSYARGQLLSRSEREIATRVFAREQSLGRATMSYREVLVRLEDEQTRVFVFIEASGDVPFGLHGWHAKSFAPSYTALELLSMWVARAEKFGEPALWPQGKP